MVDRASSRRTSRRPSPLLCAVPARSARRLVARVLHEPILWDAAIKSSARSIAPNLLGALTTPTLRLRNPAKRRMEPQGSPPTADRAGRLRHDCARNGQLRSITMTGKLAMRLLVTAISTASPPAHAELTAEQLAKLAQNPIADLANRPMKKVCLSAALWLGDSIIAVWRVDQRRNSSCATALGPLRRSCGALWTDCSREPGVMAQRPPGCAVARGCTRWRSA